MPKKPWDPDPREDLDPRNWFDARPDPWEEPRRFTDEREPPPPRPQFPKEPTGTTLPNLPFRWQDIYDCYPMPEWVRERIESYPQQSVGDALDDPLPVPFTAPEVKDALREVCEASFSRPSGCSPWAQPGSVHIALEVLRILQTRNGGWIRIRLFRSPEVGWPEVPAGAVFDLDLECQLVKLVGKPLPHEHCRRAAPAARLIYEVDRLTTTFNSSAPHPTESIPTGSGHPALPELVQIGAAPSSVRTSLRGLTGPYSSLTPLQRTTVHPQAIDAAFGDPRKVARAAPTPLPAALQGPYARGVFHVTQTFTIKELSLPRKAIEGCSCASREPTFRP